MSIHLVRVSKAVDSKPAGASKPAAASAALWPKPVSRTVALWDVSLTVPCNKVISVEGGGNDHRLMLLRLLHGSSRPDRGAVVSHGVRVSPILNYGCVAGTLLIPGLTVRENIAFQAQLSHMPVKLLTEFVVSASDCAKELDAFARTLNWRFRWAVETALFAAIPYDYYLVDQFDKVPSFVQMQLFYAAQRRNAALIFATNQPNVTAKFREIALVMASGSVSFQQCDTSAPAATSEG